MTCREVMTPNPFCCQPTESVAHIAKMMRAEDIGAVPVCEDHGSRKLVGIVTDRDLAVKVVADGRDTRRTTAKDIMSRGVVACRVDDDLEDALEVMESNQVRRLPVVDDKEKLVGMIAQADIAIRAGHPEKTAQFVEEVSRPNLQPM